MRAMTALLVALLAGLAALAGPSEEPAESRQGAKSERSQEEREALRPVEDVPGLPRVLLVGDSISIGYTKPVRDLLAGRANVHRIPENGGNTRKGLLRIDAWLGDSKWDVIHFNWGLHDIRLDAQGRTDRSGPNAVPIAEYEKNVRALVARLEKTGARLIWASTTPVPEGESKRNPEDVGRYNGIAATIMAERGIPIDDLFAVSTERCGSLHSGPGNVHYKVEGSKVLAESVTRSIEAALEGPLAISSRRQ